MNTAPTIGEKVRVRRAELGIRQQDIADSCGVNRLTIHNIEHEVSNPNFPLAKLLSLHLSFSLDSVLPNKDAVLEKDAVAKEKSRMLSLAHHRVTMALKNGDIVKKPCEVCGNTSSEAHHDNYNVSHWLIVRWFCRKHHKQWHEKNDAVFPTSSRKDRVCSCSLNGPSTCDLCFPSGYPKK